MPPTTRGQKRKAESPPPAAKKNKKVQVVAPKKRAKKAAPVVEETQDTNYDTDESEKIEELGPDELYDAAMEELSIIMNRARIYRPESLDEEPEDPKDVLDWDFGTIEHPLSRVREKGIGHHLEYIAKMKKTWYPESGKYGFPEKWFEHDDKIVLSNNRPWMDDSYDREKVNHTRMSFYLEPIAEHLEKLTDDELEARHNAGFDEDEDLLFEPDFWLIRRTHRPLKKGVEQGDQRGPPVEELFRPEAYPMLERYMEIANMPYGEFNVELALETFFTNVPACWLLLNPKSRFPPPMKCPQPNKPVTFALVANKVRPFKKHEVQAARDWKVSLSHPALLVAMKGPAAWPAYCPRVEPPSDPMWLEADEEQRLQWCLQELALAVQPSLETMVLTHTYKVEGEAEEDHDGAADELPNDKYLLPDSAFVIGLLFDWENLYIVAHMAVLPPNRNSPQPIQYRSVVIDQIPFLRPPDGNSDDRYCLVGRAKMGLALMACQRHIFRASQVYDSAALPYRLSMYEEDQVGFVPRGANHSPDRAPERKRRAPSVDGQTKSDIELRREIEEDDNWDIEQYDVDEMERDMEAEIEDPVKKETRMKDIWAGMHVKAKPAVNLWRTRNAKEERKGRARTRQRH